MSVGAEKFLFDLSFDAPVAVEPEVEENQETEEAPGDGEHMVDGDGLHGEIAPHVEEERRIEGA